jgi:hypothetical protein
MAMPDRTWPESLKPARPLVQETMTDRQRDEAEEAARIEAMSDLDVVVAIRAHLTRAFIGRRTEDRQVVRDDGGLDVMTVRKPHRFVEVFDELVRAYARNNR